MHDEFALDPELLYLNHAGVAPWPRRTARAVTAFAEENIHRGAADYPQWMTVEKRLRERLARLVDADGVDDIALVKNTSEGLSLIAYGVDWEPGDNVVINDREFPSNRMVWESLAGRFGVEVRDVSLDDGDTPEQAIVEAMDDRTRLLPVSAVQYGNGLRMDLGRLGAACEAHGTLFCVDAIQALGARRFSAREIGAHFVTADGHKWMLGPEGVGVLYVSAAVRPHLNLTQYGWHMAEAMGEYERHDWLPATSARRFEAGSPNSLGVHALDASLSLLEEIGMDQVEGRVLALSAHLLERIDAEPQLESVTPGDPERHAGIVTFRVADAEPAALLKALRAEGIACAARGGGIRFSAHFYQDEAQLDRAVDRVLALRGKQ